MPFWQFQDSFETLVTLFYSEHAKLVFYNTETSRSPCLCSPFTVHLFIIQGKTKRTQANNLYHWPRLFCVQPVCVKIEEEAYERRLNVWGAWMICGWFLSCPWRIPVKRISRPAMPILSPCWAIRSPITLSNRWWIILATLGKQGERRSSANESTLNLLYIDPTVASLPTRTTRMTMIPIAHFLWNRMHPPFVTIRAIDGRPVIPPGLRCSQSKPTCLLTLPNEPK